MDNKYKVSVPPGRSGDWYIEKFSVNKDQARLFNLRCRNPFERIKPGDYTRLRYGQEVVMSDTPMEVYSNRWIIHKSFGNVLLNGLGLGMVLQSLLRCEDIKYVAIIEISKDVIKLVEPHYKKMFGDDRFTVIHANALEYKFPKNTPKFDFIWHDIWTYICGDNYEEMKKLHRKYGRFAWCQKSWKREEAMKHFKRGY